MLWLSGAHRRIGYGIGGGGSFLTDEITPDLSRPHRIRVWRACWRPRESLGPELSGSI